MCSTIIGESVSSFLALMKTKVVSSIGSNENFACITGSVLYSSKKSG